jgi:hypothetical protein
MLKKTLQLNLTLMVALAATVPAFADAINSSNDGRDIAGGTYYNTSGQQTTFYNSTNGGLWLHSGQTVRGLEVDAVGNPTGNGGSILLNAPGAVVRLDGNIDVNALRSGSAYVGNGGNVQINAGYLYQNGNIFASGSNGGAVNMNVGAAMFGATSSIQAMGETGKGGSININANSGTVDIKQGARLFTKGQTDLGLNANVITVQGGLVNNNGIIKAAGMEGFGQDGGKIVLRATGPADSNAIALINANAGGPTSIFTAAEASAATGSISSYVSNVNLNGSVKNDAKGQVSADGSSDNLLTSGFGGGNGGSIEMISGNGVFNNGYISSLGAVGTYGDGGNGGNVTLTATKNVSNGGVVRVAGGNGGDIGRIDTMATSSLAITDDATIDTILATGGDGGNGGNITVNTANFNNTANAQMNANGGAGGTGDVAGGEGGDGGSINLNTTNRSNNDGSLYANGGNDGREGTAPVAGQGGAGGSVTSTTPVTGSGQTQTYSGNGN